MHACIHTHTHSQIHMHELAYILQFTVIPMCCLVLIFSMTLLQVSSIFPQSSSTIHSTILLCIQHENLHSYFHHLPHENLHAYFHHLHSDASSFWFLKYSFLWKICHCRWCCLIRPDNFKVIFPPYIGLNCIYILGVVNTYSIFIFLINLMFLLNRWFYLKLGIVCKLELS